MATLRDVANEANVSLITVSRVINEPEKVKPKTRQRIEAAMKKFNYTPNPVAKALVSKRIGVVDVYVPHSIDLSNPFVMHFIAGISEALSAHMYSFMIRRDRDTEHMSDGYIATGLLKDEIYEMYAYAKERNRPLVLFGHTDIPDVSCIDVDNITGARSVTEYLLKAGHRKLAMINVDENKDYTMDRLEGFRRAAGAYGVDAGTCPVVYAENSAQGGYTAAQALAESSPDLTALFCATDTIALGAVRAYTEAGRKIPGDVSVAGFDGLGHHLLTNPRITTVQQPVFEVGKMLADTLIHTIQGKAKTIKTLMTPELIIEESVR